VVGDPGIGRREDEATQFCLDETHRAAASCVSRNWGRPVSFGRARLRAAEIVGHGEVLAKEDRPTDLAFGVAAGFITLLAIRGGKNVFLLQSEEVSFYLNPYSSAFFGLLAGLFTNDAFQVLRKFVKKFVVSLERTFELPTGEDAESPGSRSPSDTDESSGRKADPEGPSRQPPGDGAAEGNSPDT
jgi:hypothetical protein